MKTSIGTPLETQIREVLQQTFSPQFMQLENESYKHNVPVGSERHFKLCLVSEAFSGLSRISRHRLVYTCLERLFAEKKLHALTMNLFTNDEWQTHEKNNVSLPTSPPCLGGERGSKKN